MSILVVAENSNTEIKSSTLNSINAASKINDDIHLVVIGNQCEEVAKKAALIEKLKKVISVPYTIKDQSAGIRPTVKDRRPMVGVHHIYKQLSVLNGLGTRGVMIAPTVAENLFDHLEFGKKLDQQINIKRFEKN